VPRIEASRRGSAWRFRRRCVERTHRHCADNRKGAPRRSIGLKQQSSPDAAPSDGLPSPDHGSAPRA
jgi:hypothetical protein